MTNALTHPLTKHGMLSPMQGVNEYDTVAAPANVPIMVKAIRGPEYAR